MMLFMGHRTVECSEISNLLYLFVEIACSSLQTLSIKFMHKMLEICKHPYLILENQSVKVHRELIVLKLSLLNQVFL